MYFCGKMPFELNRFRKSVMRQTDETTSLHIYYCVAAK